MTWCAHFAPLVFVLLLYGQGVESRRKPGTIECLKDSHCGDNALCREEGFCDCKPGFYKNSYDIPIQCIPILNEYGAACLFNKQCQITWGTMAECRDEGSGPQCLCMKHAHLVTEENQCFQTRRVGQSCDFNQNCVTKGNVRAICERGFCTCPYQYREIEDGTLCIPSLSLGEVCTRDEECAGWGSHARCLQQVCRCRIGYVISSDNRTCLQAANALDESCLEHAQCSEFVLHSMCYQGKCDCVSNYHRLPGGSRCWNRRDLDEECTFSEECILASGNRDRIMCDMLTKVCRCKNGYEPTRDYSDCKKSSDGILIQSNDLLLLLISFLIFINCNIINL